MTAGAGRRKPLRTGLVFLKCAFFHDGRKRTKKERRVEEGRSADPLLLPSRSPFMKEGQPAQPGTTSYRVAIETENPWAEIWVHRNVWENPGFM